MANDNVVLDSVDIVMPEYCYYHTFGGNKKRHGDVRDNNAIFH